MTIKVPVHLHCPGRVFAHELSSCKRFEHYALCADATQLFVPADRHRQKEGGGVNLEDRGVNLEDRGVNQVYRGV